MPKDTAHHRAYEKALKNIYSSYMAVKKNLSGLFDREYRNPKIILDIAKALNLLPVPQQIIKITGSKGKGTTSRMIACILHKQGKKTGLLLSPEEFEHTDRMRINEKPISLKDFIRIYKRLSPTVTQAEQKLPRGGYISPSGYFLLLALYWFKECGVQVFVLETGRGARFDEVGNIASRISVVTSILPEHINCLGPAIQDIAREKLYVAENSDITLLGKGYAQFAEPLLENVHIVVLKNRGGDSVFLPDWYWQNHELALYAVKHFLRDFDPRMTSPVLVQSSCGFGVVHHKKAWYEPLVEHHALDCSFFSKLKGNGSGLVFLSLPDDKDLFQITTLFLNMGFQVVHIPLTGTRGYLLYTKTKKYFSTASLSAIHYQDTQQLSQLVKHAIKQYKPDILIFAGTQTYIRLVKKSFFRKKALKAREK